MNIETEIKFRLQNFERIENIYASLSDSFILYPYDKSMLYDIYYDTENFDLLKSGYSYRVRNKRNRSLNFKTKGEVIYGLLSRIEYRDEIDYGIQNDSVLNFNCQTNAIARKIFPSVLQKKITLCSYRTSFILYYKSANDVKKFGVCSFDQFFEKNIKKKYYEVEIESCDERLSSDLFNSFMTIKSKFDFLGIPNITSNKYSTLMKDIGI